jgi:competence protein ComEA
VPTVGGIHALQEERVSPPESKPEPSAKSPLLRRTDQAAVAALVLVALVSVAAYWLVHGGAGGKLIEIDRAPRGSARFQIDVNQADWPEFSQLPGIGEALARRIVESRAADGRYADVDELLRVRGIGPKTLERIKPYLLPVPGAGNVAAGPE